MEIKDEELIKKLRHGVYGINRIQLCLDAADRLEALVKRVQDLEGNLKEVETQPKWEPYPDYGDIYPVENFQQHVAMGCITPDDGSGYYGTASEMSCIDCFTDKPTWATHVAWFNK